MLVFASRPFPSLGSPQRRSLFRRIDRGMGLVNSQRGYLIQAAVYRRKTACGFPQAVCEVYYVRYDYGALARRNSTGAELETVPVNEAEPLAPAVMFVTVVHVWRSVEDWIP